MIQLSFEHGGHCTYTRNILDCCSGNSGAQWLCVYTTQLYASRIDVCNLLFKNPFPREDLLATTCQPLLFGEKQLRVWESLKSFVQGTALPMHLHSSLFMYIDCVHRPP